MAMKSLREGASGGLGKFVLLGILGLAVGGLVMTDIGGFFRGGVSGNDVAKVGNEQIGIAEFDRTLRESLTRIGLSPQEAFELGYVNQVLNAEINAKITAQAARELGIEISNELIAEQTRKLVAPLVQPGQTARDVFDQILATQRLSEAEFAQRMREDLASNLLLEALRAGFARPAEPVASMLFQLREEKRDIKYISFLAEDIEQEIAPNDEQLQRIYESTKELYAIPERRVFKFIEIDDSALKQTIDIDKETLRSYYEDNIDLFTRPASRVIEQALVSSQEQAGRIFDKVKDGAALEAAVEEVTGSKTAYLDEETVSEDDLLEQLKGPVLSAGEPGSVLEPLQSPLGWHVVIVKETHEKKVQSFEEVRDGIKEDLLYTELIDQLYELANMVDDSFASGMNVDEVKEVIALNVTDYPPVNAQGQDAQGDNALEDLGDLQDTILENVFSLMEEEASPVFETGDGKFISVYVEEIQPKNYPPFESVKEEIAANFILQQKQAQAVLQANQALRTISESGIAFEDYAKENDKTVQTQTGLGRGDEIADPLENSFAVQIFGTPPGTPFINRSDKGAFVITVSNANAPEPDDFDQSLYESLQANLTQAEHSEALALFVFDRRQAYGVSINQNLLQRTYGPGSPFF